MRYVLLTLLAYLVAWLVLAAWTPPPSPLDAEFEVRGCRDPTALNYYPWANREDGSCVPAVLGCSRPWAYVHNGNQEDGSCFGPTDSLKQLFVFANAGSVLVRDLRGSSSGNGRYFILPNDRPLEYAREALRLSGSNRQGEKRLLVAAPGAAVAADRPAQPGLEYDSDALPVANRTELYYPLVICRSYGSMMHNGFLLEEVPQAEAGFLAGLSGTVTSGAAVVPRFALEALSRGRKYFFVENGQRLRLLASEDAERRFHALLQLRQLEDFYVNAYTNGINAEGEAIGDAEVFSLYSIEHVYYSNRQMYEHPGHVVLLFRARDFRGEPIVLPPGYFALEEEVHSLRVPAGHALVLFARDQQDGFLPTAFPERHIHRGAFVRAFVAGDKPLEVPRLLLDAYAAHVLPVDFGVTLFSGPGLTGLAWNLPFGYFRLRETPFAAPFAPRSARIAAPNSLLRIFTDVLMRREAFRFGALLQGGFYDLEIPAEAFAGRPAAALILEQFQDNVMLLNGMFRAEVLDFGANVVENAAVTATERILVNEVRESCLEAGGPRGCFERTFLLRADQLDLPALSKAARFVLTTEQGGFEMGPAAAARALQEEAGVFNLLMQDGDSLVAQSALFQFGLIQNSVTTTRIAFTLKHFDWLFLDVNSRYIGYVAANQFNLISKLYNSPAELDRVVFDFARVVLLDAANQVLAIVRDQSHPVFAEFQKISTDFPINFLEFRLKTKETLLWLKENIRPFIVRARQLQ